MVITTTPLQHTVKMNLNRTPIAVVLYYFKLFACIFLYCIIHINCQTNFGYILITNVNYIGNLSETYSKVISS